MKGRFLGIACVAAGIVSGCATRPSQSEDALAPVSFMAGTWRTGQGAGEAGEWTEEVWTAPAGGMMLGTARSVSTTPEGAARVHAFEFLRLAATAEGITYYAMPEGRSPATEFRLVQSRTGEAVFENEGHDFPQRIVYSSMGPRTLRARIERLDGSGRMEWRYDRQE